jgi:hypothetical protein
MIGRAQGETRVERQLVATFDRRRRRFFPDERIRVLVAVHFDPPLQRIAITRGGVAKEGDAGGAEAHAGFWVITNLSGQTAAAKPVMRRIGGNSPEGHMDLGKGNRLGRPFADQVDPIVA